MSAVRLLVYALIGFVILVALWVASWRDPTPEEQSRKERIAELNAATVTKRDALVKQATKDGMIRKVTCAPYEAQVSAPTWRVLDADGKKTLTLLLAQWCADQQMRNRMAVIDAQSGQTLATFDGSTYSVK